MGMTSPGVSSIAVAVAASLAMSVPATAHAARLWYVIDAGVEHDDNVRLAATEPDRQLIRRAGLGFLATQEGSTVQALVAGRADYRDFEGGADTGVEGVLSAYLNWVLAQDRLSFTFQDELELQSIDRFAADSPDNRQQVNVASLGPNLLFDVGQTLKGRLEARYIDTHAEVTDEFDSSRLGAALRIAKAFDPNSNLGFNAQWTDVDYDHDLLARDHERTDLYARYARTQADTDYAIDAGFSRLEYDDGQRSEGPLFRFEAGWRPGERTRLALTLVNQFSDAADAALADGVADRPAAGVPGGVLRDDGAVVPSTYREKRVAFGWTYSGERVGWRLEPYAQRLRYIDRLQPDEDGEGAMFGLDYRITPSLTLMASGAFERIEYMQLAAEDDILRTSLVLEKRWTRQWSTSLSYYRYERDSDILDRKVRQNVWYLWMSYRNRPL
jgi:hypothetical protein